MNNQEEQLRKTARILRYIVIKNALAEELITEEEAKDCLNGNLTPNDPNTYADDRDLLGKSIEEVMKIFEVGKTPNE